MSLAVFIVSLLVDQLKQVRLNVCTVQQVVGVSLDRLSVTSRFVGLSIRGRGLLAVFEVLDRGVTFNTEFLGECLVLSRVDLSEFHFTFQVGSCLVPLGLKSLAVTAPGSVELDHPDVFGIVDSVIEVGVSQNEDLRPISFLASSFSR